MNYLSSLRFKKAEGGQALVEFCMMLVLLCMFIYGVIEFARVVALSHRVASAAREGGRVFIANDITPAQETTHSANKANMTTEIESKVYDTIKDMISPADLPNKGKVIISILKRVDDLDDTDYNDPATYDDDYVEIEYQFTYPTTIGITEARSAWASKIGNETDRISTNTVTKLIPVEGLRIEERTVAVEIFHETELIDAVNYLLGAWDFDHIYDYAVF